MKFARAALALALVTMAVPAIVEAQAKPVIAVMYFENNTIGKDRADYDGIGKGISELLITDMAANPNVRVVERERIQALLVEQNLVKEKHIDPQTAIRLGKIIGAQYMITGGLQSNGKGDFILTSRVINVETSAITNPVKMPSKGDDMLALIAQLSTKLNTEMKLPALQVGQAGSAPATPAVQQTSTPSAPAATNAAAPGKAPAAQQVASKPASNRKMDMKTAMLYSKALEEEDAGNRAKAVELYRQVDVVFPNFAPVTAKLRKLS